MKIQVSAIASACVLAGTIVIAPVSAQTMDEMRRELKKLREEINALKAPKVIDAPVADVSGLSARVVTLETNAKRTVVVGDIGGTPGGFQIPGSSASLRVYGIAEAHAIHDFKQSSSPDLFTDLTFQPLDSSGGSRGKTKFTAETSRFGFDTSTVTAGGLLTTKVEADFYSYATDNRNRVRLRHAYGEYGGWLIGRTWSTFMDLDDLPETIDFNGAVGAPFSRRTMIRYSFGDATANYKVTLAAEDPEDQFGGGSTNERTPQLIARIDKRFNWGAVNLRMLAHEKRSATQIKRGYGFAVGGNYKLTDKDTVMAQYTLLDGDIDQLYGSNGYAINAATGKITFDRNQGVVFGYSRALSEKLRGSVALGANRGQTAQAADNRTMAELFANLIYSPIKNLDLGAEFIYGKRKTFAGEVGTLSRIDLMSRYTF